MSITSITTLITIIGVLVAIVNILTEVLKKVMWDKIPTNLLVTVISIALTLVSGGAYAQMNSIAIMWYYIVAAVIVGFMVAYAAMFGFDKLKEILSQFENIKVEKDGN